MFALSVLGTACSFRGDDQEANDHLPDGRVVVARGEGWTFFAWDSAGLCMSLWFGDREGGTGCGIPVVGARPRGEPGRELVAAGTSYRGLSKDDLWINGVAAANGRRVEVELADGRRLQTAFYDAPAALGLDLKFFLVRTRFHLRNALRQRVEDRSPRTPASRFQCL